ncbi:MAG TPA: pentapeptide repeat-containing protein [Thermomicrobiaceae bacterium]|jgi:uncharacterized protein YjbI with pentapeptide repeats|nr:pentapeptide repeat-containing protein [Thermomicrobiaceae bacterium]
MDRDQFDRLSRLVAASGTRRAALRALVVGAAAGVVTVATSGEDAQAGHKHRKSKGRKRTARAEQEQPLCPSRCNRNCSDVPLHGGVDLSKCDLNERDLDGVDLSGSQLTNTCFGGSSLRDARFRGVSANKACFCGADLTGADFRGSNVTQAQLDCANLACNTILPNGKRAVTCDPGERCCDGVCANTGSDPNNCGACGVQCGVCQFCNFGTCETLEDFKFDCNGDPLRITEGRACTAGPNTGICDGGLCNCGPGGRYDEEANVCLCNQTNTEFCQSEFGNCCEIESTCLVGGSVFESEFQCPACGAGGTPYSNLCCEYLCAASGPGPRPKKYVCIDNAVPGQTRCDSSFQSCSFNDAQFVSSCSSCGSN